MKAASAAGDAPANASSAPAQDAGQARTRRARQVTRVLLTVAGPLLLLLLWSWSSRSYGAPILYPGPGKTLAAFLSLLQEGRIFADIGISLFRIFVGFCVGWVLGFVFGLLAGQFHTVHVLIQPYLQFFRFISPIAWLPTVLLWFGSGELGKIVLIAYTTGFIVCVNTIEGIAAMPRNYVRAAHCFGASLPQIFRHVTLPAALGYGLTGARLAIANSFATVVAAEMLAAQSGLGYLSWTSRQSLSVDIIFASLVCLGILGFAADRIILFIQNVPCRRYTQGRG